MQLRIDKMTGSLSSNGPLAAPFQVEKRTSFSSFPASQKSSASITLHNRQSQTSLAPKSSAASSRKSYQLDSPPDESGSLSKSRRLKSQYPLDSPEKHVEYILVASFDIDRGPIMEHQYPGLISPDEHMLAELMLPDQTHVRTQDWTMFFLHKDSGANGDGDETGDAKTKAKAKKGKDSAEADGEDGENEDSETSSDEEDDSDDDDDTAEGPPLMYVLNLVNTKQDNTVKR